MGDGGFGSPWRRGGWFTAVFAALSLIGAGTFAVAEIDPGITCPASGSPLPPDAWPEQCPPPEGESTGVPSSADAPADAPEAPGQAVPEDLVEDPSSAPALTPLPTPAGAPADRPESHDDEPSSIDTAAGEVTVPPEATASGGASPSTTSAGHTPASAGTPSPTPQATAGPGQPAVAPSAAEPLPKTPQVTAPPATQPYAVHLPPAAGRGPDDAPVGGVEPSREVLDDLAKKASRTTAGPTRTARPAPASSPPSGPDGTAHVHGTEESAGAALTFPTVDVDWSAFSPLAGPSFAASETARFPGPAFLLPIYEAAGAEYGVPWQVLAAINEIETNFGRNQGPSSAGAVGWMQFLPSTWQAYGVDAGGDGVRNPADPVDAIFSAANYLRAAGAPGDMGRAVFAYNHAGWYVERVLRRAAEFGRIPSDLLAAMSRHGRKDADAIRRATGGTGYLDERADPDSLGRVLLLDDESLRAAVLDDDRISVYPCGRGDIADGIVDRRVLEVLAILAFRDLRPTVSSLRCGHGYLTAGGSVSDHSHGGAVDIAAINGTPIAGNQGAGSVTDDAIRELLKLQGGARPSQIISLMRYAGASNTLALSDHDDHIHVAFRALGEIDGDGSDAR